MKIVSCISCRCRKKAIPRTKLCGQYQFNTSIDGRFIKEDIPEMIKLLQKFLDDGCEESIDGCEESKRSIGPN